MHTDDLMFSQRTFILLIFSTLLVITLSFYAPADELTGSCAGKFFSKHTLPKAFTLPLCILHHKGYAMTLEIYGLGT